MGFRGLLQRCCLGIKVRDSKPKKQAPLPLPLPRVEDSGFRKLRVQGLRFRVWGLGFRT